MILGAINTKVYSSTVTQPGDALIDDTDVLFRAIYRLWPELPSTFQHLGPVRQTVPRLRPAQCRVKPQVQLGGLTSRWDQVSVGSGQRGIRMPKWEQGAKYVLCIDQ